MKKATFPAMGHYTEAFAWLIEQLGFEPVIPPKTTQETIKLGVRHSSSMVCFPFKVTLGHLIQGLENGAEVIVAVGVPENGKEESCRFCYYYHVQEKILRSLGYKFDIVYLRGQGLQIMKDFKRINPNLNYWKTWKILRGTYKKIQEIERKQFTFEKKKINIGLTGEAFTLWEPGVNYDIINKLKNLGVGVDVSISLSWFLKHHVGMADTKKHLLPEVKKYFPKRIGGHGYESIYNTIDYAHKNFDAVFHFAPLTCMPESFVEMVMDLISEDYDIPVYHFPIDEESFQTGFDMRIKSIIRSLERNKK